MIEQRVLTLSEAADCMGWSRRTLTRALERHGIPTIGIGRRARLELADLENLKAKERAACSSIRPEPAKATAAGSLAFTSMDSKERGYLRRRLGQLRRKKPSRSGADTKVVPLER